MGTNWSLHPKVKPNLLRNIFHVQNMSLWKKRTKSHAGHFPLPQCSHSVSQKDRWLMVFFGCILKKSRAKKWRLHKKPSSHEGLFFPVFQLSVLPVVKWHFTKSLPSIWNKPANPAITDESCDAGCAYSIRSIYKNDVTEYLKDLTSSQNRVLPFAVKIHHHYFCGV